MSIKLKRGSEEKKVYKTTFSIDEKEVLQKFDTLHLQSGIRGQRADVEKSFNETFIFNFFFFWQLFDHCLPLFATR